MIGSQPSATATSSRSAHAAPVGGAVLVDLPVHEGRLRVDLLHPVHADVARPRARVARDHGRQRDERGRVARPAVLDRESVEVGLEHDLLAGARADALGHRVGEALELAEALDLLDEPLRRLHLEHVLEPRSRPRRGVGSPKARHIRRSVPNWLMRSGCSEPLTFVKRRAGPPAFTVRSTISVISRYGIDLGLDLDELALSAQQVDPIAQIARGHEVSLSGSRMCTQRELNASRTDFVDGSLPAPSMRRRRKRRWRPHAISAGRTGATTAPRRPRPRREAGAEGEGALEDGRYFGYMKAARGQRPSREKIEFDHA